MLKKILTITLAILILMCMFGCSKKDTLTTPTGIQETVPTVTIAPSEEAKTENTEPVDVEQPDDQSVEIEPEKVKSDPFKDFNNVIAHLETVHTEELADVNGDTKNALAIGYIKTFNETPTADEVKNATKDNELLEKYPLLSEIDDKRIIIMDDGSDLYYVIPMLKDVDVVVRDTEVNKDFLTLKDVVYSDNTCKPFLLVCNQYTDDWYVGNATICMEVAGVTFEFRPMLYNGQLDIVYATCPVLNLG